MGDGMWGGLLATVIGFGVVVALVLAGVALSVQRGDDTPGVVAGDTSDPRVCPRCGLTRRNPSKPCEHCERAPCPDCGAVIERGETTCPMCGSGAIGEMGWPDSPDWSPHLGDEPWR